MQAPDLNAPDDADGDLHVLMQDKLETHCRQQLSALVDGALPPDEARFLLRRLQHDGALAGRWERWQVYGECMRGGVSQLLPADFSQRVCAALDAEAARAVPAVAAARAVRPAWTRWAGRAALAASVAMAAFVVVQRNPAEGDAGDAVQVASSPAAAPSNPVASVVQPDASQRAPTSGGSALPSAATAGALLLAARDVPRRNQARGTASGRRVQPVSSRSVFESPVPAVAQAAPMQAVAASSGGLEAASATRRDPFYVDVAAEARPWPRAVLPGMAQGGFSVAYGTPSSNAGAFQHFEPRLADGDEQRVVPAAADEDR